MPRVCLTRRSTGSNSSVGEARGRGQGKLKKKPLRKTQAAMKPWGHGSGETDTARHLVGKRFIDRKTRTHLGQSSQHCPESLHSFSPSFVVAESCPWSRDSPALACSLDTSGRLAHLLLQSLDPWLGTGTAFGETRIASCASIPNPPPLPSHLPSHLHIISIVRRSSSVSQLTRRLRIIAPSAGVLPSSSAGHDTNAYR